MKKAPSSPIEAVLGVSPETAIELLKTLTPGERDVAESLAAGLTTYEIAAKRGRSVKTVNVQLGYAMQKLKARHYIDVARIVYAAKLANFG